MARYSYPVAAASVRTTIRGSYSTAETSAFQTALSLSGAGCLRYLKAISPSSSSRIRITIDGTTVIEGTTFNNVNGQQVTSYLRNALMLTSNTRITLSDSEPWDIDLNLEFKNSLLIEVVKGVEGDTMTIEWMINKG